MTVTANVIDTWIQHLPFTGRRPTIYGPVDGVWYGHIAVVGDAGGGNVHLHGILSAGKKTEWVYIIGNVTAATNTATQTGDGLINVASGPLIPSVATNQFVSMTVAAVPVLPVSALGFTGMNPVGGAFAMSGVPVFGDRQISGDFNIISSDWENNVNTAVYRLDAWGFLVRYEGFFREVAPSLS